MSDDNPAAETSLLLMTDRSRIATHWAACPRNRFLEYHAGPDGIGFRLKRVSIPLSTGGTLHEPLADALLYMKSEGRVPSREAFRPMVVKAVGSYMARVSGRGFQGNLPEHDERILQEQRVLLEGLAWTAWKILLPAIHEHFAVVDAEVEIEYVIDCSCGLGDGQFNFADHEQKNCLGLGLQIKPDGILRERSTSQLVVLDWKSDGNVHRYNWAEQFRTSVQMALQRAGAEKHLGEGVLGGIYIAGLHKGWRAAPKENEEIPGLRGHAIPERGQLKLQQSPFCYAWRSPANPPLEEERWKFDYWYEEYDEKKGVMVNRNLRGKGFQKAPIWEANFPDKPKSWTNTEMVIEMLGDEKLSTQVKLAGPLYPSELMLQKTLGAIKLQETRVAKALWKLYEIAETYGELSPEYEAALDAEFPQTWECKRYTVVCQFAPICDREAGWQDPLGSGRYELRRPHHAAELAQVESRGIVLPVEQELED